MRASELRLIEAARAADALPHFRLKKEKPARVVSRDERFHDEVIGIFKALGVVDREDPVTHARGQRRIS